MAKIWRVIECRRSPTNHYEEMTIEESYHPNFVMKLLFSPSTKRRKFYGNSTVWYELPSFRHCDEDECEELQALQRQWHYENHNFEPLVFMTPHYN